MRGSPITRPSTTERGFMQLAKPRRNTGKDVWLWGGGSLFRSFAELELVDTVEVAVIPVLLGEGVPLLTPAQEVSLARRVQARILHQREQITVTAGGDEAKHAVLLRRQLDQDDAAAGA